MSQINTLDVTRIEPRLKHPTIFQHFDALEEGEAFVIHNDHDPKPLYYQLLSEKGNIFNWQYLEQGPEVWEIQISKKRLSTSEETIGAIAAKDLRKAEVFKKLGLEFCCGGKKSLDEACEDAGVSVNDVNEALKNLPEEPIRADRDYYNWNLDFLTDYIVNVHHKYVNDTTPMLLDLAQKIASHHGGAHPELLVIKSHVFTLLKEMATHQDKEEKILFPFIRQMAQAQREGKPFTYPPSGSIGDPVEMMYEDHDVAAEHIHAIEKLSDKYQVPADGCESYRLYYHKLKELDDDLHHHIHLENNILFPKAIALEKDLSN